MQESNNRHETLDDCFPRHHEEAMKLTKETLEKHLEIFKRLKEK